MSKLPEMNCLIRIYQTDDDNFLTLHLDKKDAVDTAFCLQSSPAVNRFMVKIDDEPVNEFKDALPMSKLMKKENEK